MVGLFKLGATASAKKKTGLKIIALVKSVGAMPESADLKAFKENPRAWLHAAGYMYDGPGAGLNGEIPATVKIVPVFDTADTMHVRVPFKDALLINPADIPVSETYPSGLEDRFPVFLARYFMRQCR